jgi:transcriptional regulator with XRE-family HTH domain
MKLTPFGEAVRNLRMRLDVSLKSTAEFMGISASHLSGMEYGEKRLSQKHIDSAIAYFTSMGASGEEIAAIGRAAEKSKDVVSTKDLTPDARGLVAAFARRLQEGSAPTPEILKWIKSRGEEHD